MAKAKFDKTNAGVTCKTKSGKKFTLLNPSEKASKCAVELHTGKNVYTGKHLSDTQMSFRAGYLQAREDNAKCYKAKKSRVKTYKKTTYKK